jgi:hypothetical protein
MTEVNWDELAKRYPAELVAAIRKLFREGERFTITAEAAAADTTSGVDQAADLLNDLSPPLETESRLTCGNCGEPLTKEEAEQDVCPTCEEQYADFGGVRISKVFAYRVPRSRDVKWVLSLHGMNTRGAWQLESFDCIYAKRTSRDIQIRPRTPRRALDTFSPAKGWKDCAQNCQTSGGNG